jgi:hypothetical protein
VVLKRLQKTEVSMSRNAVPSKKIRKGAVGGTRVGSCFGGTERSLGDVDLSCFDKAEVQVPATPAPKKTIAF